MASFLLELPPAPPPRLPAERMSMQRTLYGVLQDTRHTAARIREQGIELDAEISNKLAHFEASIDHALASSPDGVTVSHPEEYVALDALCDLHLSLQSRPDSLRSLLRPIVDEWIAYAASTGLTPQELAQSATRESIQKVDGWLSSLD